MYKQNLRIFLIACTVITGTILDARHARAWDLVSTARQFVGQNPTGRKRLWCGAFLDYVLQRTGHKPGSDLASDYAHYGRRVHGPVVGAIAVMSRRGGGHAGIVSGIDERGNPILISGNSGGRGPGRRVVSEHTYPRGRIYAYVMPN